MAGRQFSDRNEGSPTVGPAGTRLSQQGLAAAAVAVVAFVCYHATLLPGLDFGDSASFQTGVGSLTLTPRQAYPLYYGLGSLLVWLHPGEPAQAMNLASALFGAFAAGLMTLLACRLTESIPGGLAAGTFLAFSYTFWTQAVTAEVYTLHLLILGASIVALLAWADQPTEYRLGAFYGLYGLGFGNHLSMILLLPAFVVFLLLHRRAGPSDPLRPRSIALAAAIGSLCASQYLWNLRGLWVLPELPSSFVAGLGTFWFDVTKADWRETLVMSLSEQGLETRPAMYWFDLRQQVGVPGVWLAGIGFGYVILRWWRRGILLALVFVANFAFAWTYNVGDAYIFFLPSHYVVALCGGAGVAAIVWIARHVTTPTIALAAGALCLAYPCWRGYDTFPAVDRSGDNRAALVLDELITPMSSRPTVFGVDANWQVQNAFQYHMRERYPGVAWFTTDDLDWPMHARPDEGLRELIAANGRAGSDVIVTPRVLTNLAFTPDVLAPSDMPRPLSFGERVKSIPTGTLYALAILRPDREYPLDADALAAGWTWLAPGTPVPTLNVYTAVVGRVGSAPVFTTSHDRPYRAQTTIGREVVEIRMESWLPTDTIRRAGFGHVIVNRQHFLTLERGISFAAVTPNSRPIYWSGLFAPQARYVFSGFSNPQSRIPNP